MNGVDYSVSIYGLVLSSMLDTINERCRLQSFHATISERRRLQFFHVWFVIVHATISERRRLQYFHYGSYCPCHVLYVSRCALIRKMKHELQRRRDLYRQRRDRETEERQREVPAYVAICNLLND